MSKSDNNDVRMDDSFEELYASYNELLKQFER